MHPSRKVMRPSAFARSRIITSRKLSRAVTDAWSTLPVMSFQTIDASWSTNGCST